MNVTRPRWTRLVSRAPGSCMGGSPGPPVRAPGWSVWQDTSARWPGSGGVSTCQRWPSAPPERRSPGRTTETVPPSSRRRSWESRRSSPDAMRPATVSVGLVSPRSTCESMGAETPERSARSRRERSIPSRSARTREPNGVPASIRAYAIAYKRPTGKETRMAFDQSKIGRLAADLMDNLERHIEEDAEIGDVCLVVELISEGGSQVVSQFSSPRAHVNLGLLEVARSALMPD